MTEDVVLPQKKSAESALQKKGVIGWFVVNPVAANLLMFVLVIGGLVGALRVKQEIFPAFELDTVMVQISYPGASPREIEQSLILAVEESVSGLNGVKRVTSTASSGLGVVSIELIEGTASDKVLQDIKNAVDRISSFPEGIERPSVKLVASRSRVISLVVAAPRDMKELQQVVEQARSDLLLYPSISQVEIEGVPPVEVSVEVSQQALKAYGLSLSRVAKSIGDASVDMPGGFVKTDAGNILIRVADRRITAEQLGRIILRSGQNNSQLRLADLATINDGFAETNTASYFNGERAVRVTAYRVGMETPEEVAASVRSYAQTLRKKLPNEYTVSIWQDESEMFTDRINLLNRNALYGGILVVLILALFLRFRLAIWVSLGIPTAFLGAFFLMPSIDVSVNMITLFAFIVTLGLVVDDAIVIGENIYHKLQKGLPPVEAAVTGAKELAMPVTFSVLTTAVAFAPILILPGIMGKLFYLIPVVVFLVLGVSLLESFLILPSHIAHTRDSLKNGKTSTFYRLQAYISERLNTFILHGYGPMLKRAVTFRYLSLATAAAVLFLAIGIVAGEIVPFNFFPAIEGDLVVAKAELSSAATARDAEEVKNTLEASAMEALKKLGRAEQNNQVLQGMFASVGAGPTAMLGPRAATGIQHEHNLVAVELNLVPSSARKVGSKKVSETWKNSTPPMAGLKSLSFTGTAGPSAGAAVDIVLLSDDLNQLEQASGELAAKLNRLQSLTNVETTFSEGEKQLSYRLLPQARTMGLTSSELARQLRSAFYGVEAFREQRGRNECKVMVRYPACERQSEFNVKNMVIRTPSGGNVPLESVATASVDRAPSIFKREDGIRAVNVTAELSQTETSLKALLQRLNKDIVPNILQKYPGVNYKMAGEQRTQKETLNSLLMNYLIAIVIIFALIAVPFKSYSQPFIVMSAIPFGIVGAILGHWIMNYELGFLSIMGIVALTGVVVNDSLVLVDAINIHRRNGTELVEAIILGGKRRFRPILLTSLTTFIGLAPMITESSLQARFLIPMAISLGFGVLFSTLVTLVLVPSLYMISEDGKFILGKLKNLFQN